MRTCLLRTKTSTLTESIHLTKQQMHICFMRTKISTHNFSMHSKKINFTQYSLSIFNDEKTIL